MKQFPKIEAGGCIMCWNFVLIFSIPQSTKVGTERCAGYVAGSIWLKM